MSNGGNPRSIQFKIVFPLGGCSKWPVLTCRLSFYFTQTTDLLTSAFLFSCSFLLITCSTSIFPGIGMRTHIIKLKLPTCCFAVFQYHYKALNALSAAKLTTEPDELPGYAVSTELRPGKCKHQFKPCQIVQLMTNRWSTNSYLWGISGDGSGFVVHQELKSVFNWKSSKYVTDSEASPVYLSHCVV